ncbi:MAG: type II toxin-antitoxin system VapB family antitoxin [Dermatophilaceae bacterium]
MALSIKTEEADRLARALAAATHESITEAVTVALRERLARVRTLPRPDIVMAARLLAAEYERGAAHDPRSDEEVIGYDEHGLPL